MLNVSYKRFTYEGRGSSKGYEALILQSTREDKALLIRNWGRIGAAGQFKSERGAIADMHKVLRGIERDKGGKGYVEADRQQETLEVDEFKAKFSRFASAHGIQTQLQPFLREVAGRSTEVEEDAFEGADPVKPEFTSDKYTDNAHWGLF